MNLSLSQQISSTSWEARIWDETEPHHTILTPSGAWARCSSLEPRPDNSSRRLSHPSPDHTSPGQRRHRQDDANGKKGKEDTQPTLFVARPETERNFPGIMAGVSPGSVRSALEMTLQQRFKEPKRVRSQATRSGVTMETTISGLVLSQICGLWGRGRLDPGSYDSRRFRSGPPRARLCSPRASQVSPCGGHLLSRRDRGRRRRRKVSQGQRSPTWGPSSTLPVAGGRGRKRAGPRLPRARPPPCQPWFRFPGDRPRGAAAPTGRGGDLVVCADHCAPAC